MSEQKTPTEDAKILDVPIETELESSYLDYAMSVIVGRALPDVRDGLKPVHRRILYAMKKGGYEAGKPHRKSARIVGDVIGQFHPHGGDPVYLALVRLAQDFSMSVPLVDGHGNFGSIDGDAPAAMRYTESRLARAAQFLLDDLDNDTVDWRPNYDDSELEPTVLPAAFPNLLVNGAEGIAVGMATRIPPHNAAETIDAALALLDDPEIPLAQLMRLLPGPDFPTGGIIMGREGIQRAYETGKGSLTLRARHEIETDGKGRSAIVFTEMPFQVNKAKLGEKIEELVREKVVDGIAAVRDESSREGIRLVVEVRRDAEPEIVLAQLFKHTQLQIGFSIAMLALNGGRPMLMGLREILNAFLEFRRTVIRRRTAHLLRKAKERGHLVAGFLVALSNLDRVISIIRAAADQNAARQALAEETFDAGTLRDVLERLDEEIGDLSARHLTDPQIRAILDLRLHRLTGLARTELEEEAESLARSIAEYLRILREPAALTGKLRAELQAVRASLARERRTTIEDGVATLAIEDLIQREDMVVTITHGGYIKRVALDAYRSQRRGGKGRAGMETKEDDFVTEVITATTHTPLLFFTDRGMAFRLKVYQLPEGTPQGRGRPLVNLLPLVKDERIAAILLLPEDQTLWEGLTLAFVTASGRCRRNLLSDFARIPLNGKIAMKLSGADGTRSDRLVAVLPVGADKDIFVTSARGMVVRFPAEEVRVFSGRDSLGVRAIDLEPGDRVISAGVLDHVELAPGEAEAFLSGERSGKHRTEAPDEAPSMTLSPERRAELKAREQMVLHVTSRGYGKRTSAYAYRVTRRGAKGVNDRSDHPKIGDIVGAFVVGPDEQIMLVTDKGQMLRTRVSEIRIAGRRTAGVRLIALEGSETVVAATPVEPVAEGDSAAEDPALPGS